MCVVSCKGTTHLWPTAHPTAHRINVSLCRQQGKESDSIREAFYSSGTRQGIEDRGREEVARSHPQFEHAEFAQITPGTAEKASQAVRIMRIEHGVYGYGGRSV